MPEADRGCAAAFPKVTVLFLRDGIPSRWVGACPQTVEAQPREERVRKGGAERKERKDKETKASELF